MRGVCPKVGDCIEQKAAPLLIIWQNSIHHRTIQTYHHYKTKLVDLVVNHLEWGSEFEDKANACHGARLQTLRATWTIADF